MSAIGCNHSDEGWTELPSLNLKTFSGCFLGCNIYVCCGSILKKKKYREVMAQGQGIEK